MGGRQGCLSVVLDNKEAQMFVECKSMCGEHAVPGVVRDERVFG